MYPSLLQELVIVLAASILILLVSHKLRLPAVVGFLLTGVMIGPGGFGLVRNVRFIDGLAEIGVVMLLFTIGLEFSLERLKNIKRNFWIGGGLQVSLTITTVSLALWLLRVPLAQAVFFGFLISLSSTAVVLKIYADRSEIEAPQGRIALGILLFQDLAMVPMIAFVPVLASTGVVSGGRIVSRFVVFLLVIAGVFFAARFIMPRVLYALVKTRVREVFILASLLICLGMAFLTSSLGLSLALGAFLAGMIISESEYSHQAVAEILPFKDVFNSIFFISVGMLLDTRVFWSAKYFVLALAVSIFLVKALVVFGVVRILKYGPEKALLTGIALAQIGEFSFVLAGVGRDNGLLSGTVFQAFIASSILTIFTTPFLIQLSPALAEILGRTLRWKPRSLRGETKAVEGLSGHVVIAGYGLNGRNLARVLKASGIPYMILDLNPQTVKKVQPEEPILFGDVSSPEILKAAGLSRARAIVFAISDPKATRRGVGIARHLNRNLTIIVRTRFESEIDELYQLGADEVIPEEFETSIEIFTRVLENLHIPRNLVNAQVKLLRSERYGMLRGGSFFRPSKEKIGELLTAGTAETFFISGSSPAAGKTLGELDLRKKAGATLIAVVRGDESFSNPPADFRIQAEDTLVLFAAHKDMDAAFDFLSGSGET